MITFQKSILKNLGNLKIILTNFGKVSIFDFEKFNFENIRFLIIFNTLKSNKNKIQEIKIKLTEIFQIGVFSINAKSARFWTS